MKIPNEKNYLEQSVLHAQNFELSANDTYILNLLKLINTM